MQFRILTALAIFLGSYLPLSFILLAQDFAYENLSGQICWAPWRDDCALPFKNPFFSIGIFLACVMCLIVTLVSLRLIKPKQEILIKEAKHVPSDLMNYTLPYVVSFMSISYQDSGKFVGFVVFLVWMFWISYKSGQIILNPMLIVLNWRLYDVSYEYVGGSGVQKANVLSKGSIEAGKRYFQVPIQEILVITDTDSSGG
ncbi:hypothetical protein [Kaistia terrae]|uniref:G-protein coupled receptors family 2 profile 2 domain-containing protein n=1 Tax=Kaistia terrae TaxID=537017 RepID=A0ABW0PUD5_9HYPH|nr:hypothetical protein [Kaistia terrae]MCX5577303.1 hypothetical protein [Kaistia terrae]